MRAIREDRTRPSDHEAVGWSLAGVCRVFTRLPAVGGQSAADSDESRHARIVLSFALATVLLGAGGIAFYAWSLPRPLASLASLAFAVALGFIAGVPVAIQRGRVVVGANLMLAAGYIQGITSVLLAGGIRAPNVHWLASLPMLAVLMGSRRSAFWWAAAILLSLAGLALAHLQGVPLPHQFDSADVDQTLVWMQRLGDAIAWLATLLTIALVYEAQRRRQTHELATKAVQLESEVVQRTRAEHRNQYLAHYDDLTALPNRRLFEDRLRKASERATGTGRQVAVLFLDLDGFKSINDAYGHALGDRLLQQVAERLQGCIRGSDLASRSSASDPRVVSRLGGDEFTILLTGVRGREEAALVAERILTCLQPPFAISDYEILISASIGVAVGAGGAGTSADLLRNADMAMYYAKERGKNNFQFFDDSMNTDLLRYSTLATDLRRALDRDEMELYFQPIVAADDHRMVGVEALIRWNHPEEGLVPPGEFIGVAEGSGLMVPLGRWIFREACRQYAMWRDAGNAPGRIAVNVSGVQLRGGELAKTVVDAIEESQVDPASVELEVTEGAMLLDEEDASRCLESLKALGVRVALDDFGTGYSSLSHVKRFPVDSLKIDRSFVRDVATDPEAQAITTAIIAMAHRLGLKVVGEGVETELQERFLREHGCDELQGYRYGRPMTAGDMALRLGRQVR